DMGDSLPGLQARLMSQALRKLSGAISKSRTVVIFLNQLRMKIGVMFGSPETTTGGQALKFYASVRMDMPRIEALRLGAKRHPPNLDAQIWPGSDRYALARQSRQKQSRAAVPPGRV